MSVTLWNVLAFIGGIWSGSMLQLPFIWPAMLAAACLTAGCLYVRRNYSRALLLLAGAFLFAGVARGLQANVLPADDISNFIGKNTAVYGVVDSVPDALRVDQDNLAVRYRLRVQAVSMGAEPRTASGGVLVSVRQHENKPIYPFGAHIVVEGTLKEISGYNNPGAIDLAASMQRQGYTARLMANREPRFAGQADSGWHTKLQSLREAFIGKLKAAMPDNDAALLTGTLFGGYSGIPRESVREFAATGIIHILSVSGSHIALVAGAMHWLGWAAGLSPRAASALAAWAIVFYAALAGLSPPVVRSVAMGLIALIAAVLGRERDAANALGITAAGMLAIQPALLQDISFQLSFGGTAGLVLLYNKTQEKLQFLPDWLVRPIAATAAAQLGILPILAWYFNSIPLISFAANLIVVPAIEITVVLGLLGGFTAFLFPVVGQVMLAGCSLILSAGNHLNSLLAMLPLAVYLPPLNAAASVFYYGILLWLYGYLPILPSFSFLLRRQFTKLVCAIAFIFLIVFMGAFWPKPMSVHFIDVGQGDATLVMTPGGRAVLIDAGGSRNDAFDVGERVVYPYLRRVGVRQLDYLILTHGHQDHAGGAAAVAASVKVRHLLLPTEERTPAVEKLLLRQAFAVIPSYSGQSIILDGVEFSLLRPELSAAKRSINETSLVVEVQYGVHSFLITGDLEGHSEQQLLSQGLMPQTVLKVGHHGAKSSSSSDFLAAVSPRYAVISVGAGNGYGHPHPETLKRLSAEGSIVFRTDKHGAITFRTDGSQLTVETYLQ